MPGISHQLLNAWLKLISIILLDNHNIDINTINTEYKSTESREICTLLYSQQVARIYEKKKCTA